MVVKEAYYMPRPDRQMRKVRGANQALKINPKFHATIRIKLAAPFSEITRKCEAVEV